MNSGTLKREKKQVSKIKWADYQAASLKAEWAVGLAFLLPWVLLVMVSVVVIMEVGPLKVQELIVCKFGHRATARMKSRTQRDGMRLTTH